MTNADLIAKLEAAEGPSRELDEAIVRVWGWKPLLQPRTQKRRGWTKSDGIWLPETPTYTASLDAALSLVPEGWIWGFEYPENAWLSSKGGRFLGADDRQVFGHGATPALAICIAALRARGEG